MNEIKQIHLGRTAFTIALDAHGELRSYLAAIKKQAGQEVADEVELRMVELLTDRGISGDKVIILSDVEFLKNQLGEPKDFAGEEATADTNLNDESSENKRLYRDTQHGWLGGVASGIAAYLNIEAWVVRLTFVLLTWIWGGGIILYIILWILLPDAKTPSDRLRMQGKPVTVDTIKEFVENSPIKENAKEISDKATKAAASAGPAVSSAVKPVAKIILVIIGAALIFGALMSILSLLWGSMFAFLGPHRIFDVGWLFPLGSTEIAAVILALLVALLILILLAMCGVALVRRRWPGPAWLTVVLIALMVLASAIAAPLGVRTALNVSDRYASSKVTTGQSLSQFSKVVIEDAFDAQVEYQKSDSYGVRFVTHGDVDSSKLNANVKDGTLTITTKGYLKNNCQEFCIKISNLHIIVLAPETPNIELPGLPSFKYTIPVVQGVEYTI